MQPRIRTFLAVGGDLEVGLDGGDEARVDGVEGGVGQRDAARRSSGAEPVELGEHADPTADVRRVVHAPADAHTAVLGRAYDHDLVVRRARHAERLRVTVLRRRRRRRLHAIDPRPLCRRKTDKATEII